MKYLQEVICLSVDNYPHFQKMLNKYKGELFEEVI